MKRRRPSPEEVLESMRVFFLKNFDGFFEDASSGKITFTREFEFKNLRIVITTPVVCSDSEEIKLTSGLRIRFGVCNRKTGECLVLKDTIFSKEWEKITKEKIEALIDLIEAAPQCPTCGATTYPIQDKDHQVNPKGTYYVWYACSGSRSHKCQDTPYRIGLKKRLHRFIIKKY